MELLIDGVRYKLWTPKDEAALENIVKEHAKNIFGEDSIYFDIKHKVKTKAGIGSIPDGYAIIFGDMPNWYIVEVELSSHPLFDHIVPQMTRFSAAINDLSTQRAIIEATYREIKNDISKQALVQNKIGSREIHEFLSGLISGRPILVVIIEEKTDELEEACSLLPLETRVVEFKTFEKEGAGLAVHAHLIEPLDTGQPVEFLEELRQRFIEKKPEIKPNKVYKGYCSIPIADHPDVHTEWLFWGDEGLGVELHLQRASREENSHLLQKIRANSTELEKNIGEPLAFEFWRRKWARVYTLKEPIESTEDFKQWAVDTMVRFYEAFKPLLDEMDTKH